MKVLIVDDSIVFRSQIKAAMADIPSVEVVAAVANGKIALQKLEQMDVDLVTLDLEMPEMDGISTVGEMRKRGLKQKVIIFSSLSIAGSQSTLDALHAGADDFVTKPSGENINMNNAADIIRKELIPKIAQFAKKGEVIGPTPELSVNLPKPPARAYVKKGLYTFNPHMVVIGSSTGGPPALEKVFEFIRGPLKCPILIAQHMPPIFTKSLADRINRITGIPCDEAKSGEIIKNQIYVAPGDYHLTLSKQEGSVQAILDQGPMVNSVRPAVDPMFETASKIYGEKLMAFVLTGMGYDGMKGCQVIKENKGGVCIQNKESCVVFGMPGAVFDAQAYDEMADLEEIGKKLKKMVCT